MPESQMGQLMLRPATLDDCRRVWEWRNDPEIRRLSFDSTDIPFEDHKRWFSANIQATNTLIFLALDTHKHEVGYVRFSILESQAEISLAVDKTQRGKGYGTAAIKQGSDQILNTGVAQRVVAHVKLTNPTSVAAFQRAGFVKVGVKVLCNTNVYEMIYSSIK